jgi:hypothetical protein
VIAGEDKGIKIKHIISVNHLFHLVNALQGILGRRINNIRRREGGRVGID